LKSAIIPYRKTKNQNIEVLLVKNIKGDKWIIPKGNIKKRVAPEISSAIEAYEEAGVLGKILPFSIGEYFKNKINIPVFMLAVDTELEKYKEQKLRRRKWVTIEKAQALIKNENLFQLIFKAFEVANNDAQYFIALITALGANAPFVLSSLNDGVAKIKVSYPEKKSKLISIKRKKTKLVISIKSKIKHANRKALFNSIVKERINNKLQNNDSGMWKLSKESNNPKLKLREEIDMYHLDENNFELIVKRLITRTKNFEKNWFKNQTV